MAKKPARPRRESLIAAIISYMKPGRNAQTPSVRVARTVPGDWQRAFFYRYRYRSRDGALREIRRGEVGALTFSKARDAVARKRLEREQGKDPQLEKRKERRSDARAARSAPGCYTLEDMVNEYIKHVLDGQKRNAESARILRRDVLPVLGHLPRRKSRGANSRSRSCGPE